MSDETSRETYEQRVQREKQEAREYDEGVRAKAREHERELNKFANDETAKREEMIQARADKRHAEWLAVVEREVAALERIAGALEKAR